MSDTNNNKKMSPEEYEKLVEQLTEKILKMWRETLRHERERRPDRRK